MKNKEEKIDRLTLLCGKFDINSQKISGFAIYSTGNIWYTAPADR